MTRLLRMLPVGVLSLAIAVPVAAVSFPSRIDLPAGWQPESLTSNGTVAYVGSLANGAVWAADLRAGTGHVLVPGVMGRVAAGVEFDVAHGRLWVAGGPTGTVTAYDARTGDLLRTYVFSPAGFVNDIVATPSAIYATDSFVPPLDVIPLGPDGALPSPSATRTVPITGDLVYQPSGFNANGIVESRGTLIVDQTNTGELFTLDPGTGVSRRIDLGGSTLMFADGMEVLGDILFVVRNQANEVDVVRLGPGLLTGAVSSRLTSTSFDVPTGVTFAAGHIWVVNARFNTTPTSSTPYWITRLP